MPINHYLLHFHVLHFVFLLCHCGGIKGFILFRYKIPNRQERFNVLYIKKKIDSVSKFQVKYESDKHSINIPVLVTITAAQLNTKDKIK